MILKNKNIFVILLVVGIVLNLGLSHIFAKDDQGYEGIEFLTISSESGDWELIGGKIADLINREIQGITATSIPGGGSINMVRVQNGQEAQLGLAHTAITPLAVKGEEPFEEKHDKLVSVMTLWKSLTHVVAPKYSDLTNIEDLDKKAYSISLSKPGLAQNVIANAILDAAGIKLENIKKIGGVIHTAGMDDEAQMMKDRRLDLLVFQVVPPYNMLIDVNMAVGVRLIPIEGELRNKTIELVPGLIEDTIPAGSYKGQEEDIPTTAEFTQLFCNTDLPEDLVYDITKVLVEHIEDLRELSQSLSSISLEYAPLGLGLELHPGARRLYQEKNLI